MADPARAKRLAKRISTIVASAIEYEINVRILDHSQMNRVLSDVRVHSWYALKRAGIEMPYPQMVLHRATPPDNGVEVRRAAAGMLRSHKIFGCLTAEEQAQLTRLLDRIAESLNPPG